MTPEQKSITALQDCMKAIGLRLDQVTSRTIVAKIENIDGGRGEGYVDVIIHNDVFGHTGPYISLGEEIKGFGLTHQEYRPRYQAFKVRTAGVEVRLRVEGDDYAFTLVFERHDGDGGQ